MTKMEDDRIGRRPKWKTTKIDRRPKLIDDQNGRQMNGKQPKWKTK